MKRSSIHRGWVILVISVLNCFASLGLGRFSLGAILPFMKDGLMLSYTETGLVSSAVFMGYLIGAVGVGYLTNRCPTKSVLQAALLLIALGMLAALLAFGFWSAYLALFMIGLGSGGANVTSLSVVNRWFAAKYKGMALGITNSGSSFGIMISGSLVPILMLVYMEGWRITWGILACAVIVIFIVNLIYLRADPEQLQLKPIGYDQHASGTSERSAGRQVRLAIENIYSHKYILLMGIIYFSWGFSYLIFSTFLVDYLMTETQLSPTLAGQFFAIAGAASIISGFIWGSLSDRIGRMWTLFIIYVGQATLLVLFIVTTQPALLLLETVLYSLTLWAVPTVIVAAVADITHIRKTPMAIGFITLFFGVGQWLSPMVSGWLIDLYGGYGLAFLVSAGICYAGSLGCLALHLKLSRLTKEDVHVQQHLFSK